MSVSIPLKLKNKDLYTVFLSIINSRQLILTKYFPNLVHSHCFQDFLLEISSSFNHSSSQTGVSVRTLVPAVCLSPRKIIQVLSFLRLVSGLSRAFSRWHFTRACEASTWSILWPPVQLPLLSLPLSYSTFLADLWGRQTSSYPKSSALTVYSAIIVLLIYHPVSSSSLYSNRRFWGKITLMAPVPKVVPFLPSPSLCCFLSPCPYCPFLFNLKIYYIHLLIF